MARIDNIRIDDDTYEVGKVATTSSLGVIQVGEGLSITEEGVLSSSGGGGGAILYPTTGQNTDGAMTQKATTDALNNKADASSLSTVATSGSYSDLSNKPTIPTVNDATLTLQSNGNTVATFTANSSTNVTANIPSPIITVTDTDPGEGSQLEENHFIGVYNA